MKELTHVIRKGNRPAAKPDIPLDCFAAVPRGAEEVAARELEALGIEGAKVGRGGVSFVTNREGLYRANLWLRTASRILVQLAVFPCSSPEELYQGVHALGWAGLITPAMTLAVDCSLRDSSLTHSGFVALKTKDAIVDRIREACGSRPSVDTSSPDVRINVHLLKNVCTVSLDSSGDALDRRGYRLERTEAPLRETLAATIVALTGWDGSIPLVDPMCGSGTIPIEAALMAARIPPGLQRPFGFQRWLGYDRNVWDRLLKEADNGVRQIPVGLVTGYDQDSQSLARATKNAAKAGFQGQLHFFHAALEAFRPEAERGVVIINPPYGKRLGEEEELKELYCQIGDIMKQRCRGWTGFVITGNLELAKYIGLKASRRFVLFNGPIECRLLKYELY
ncbi:class I SAM-dependent RNA methyltransferase [Geobacter sp. SVR]|uniref:THUMP domain-containing class I SAM-dependent RNA methyltransferase n=1 Tax=Geobacter sp. SVR TaxID=2495594 RepID=UPI00143EF664|nr:THUMP domain-containing protein [Geobacter sp. SVR]BCS54898.1 RNA methyltransferase [Geobacter sp. SVR]GCF87416.1 RNA methyltransferase [Geobacter sp. SVR]